MATIKITNPYLNNQDQNSPSYLDVQISGSDQLPNGTYDAYCLQPWLTVEVSPTAYGATIEDGSDPSAYANAEVLDDDAPNAPPTQE